MVNEPSIADTVKVLEGIKKSYPNSPYIAIIEGYIAESEAYNKLAQNIEVISYPDIELLDTASKKHKLSDLNGKVTLLYFWTALNPMCNNLNADLKELYNTYHDKGFEIYHVSIDEDSLLWMTASTEQKLPWASLYGGSNSRAADLYNVVLVPTTYIIDREGNVSVAPLAMDILEREIKRCL
jgi:peroxiredoxin